MHPRFSGSVPSLLFAVALATTSLFGCSFSASSSGGAKGSSAASAKNEGEKKSDGKSSSGSSIKFSSSTKGSASSSGSGSGKGSGGSSIKLSGGTSGSSKGSASGSTKISGSGSTKVSGSVKVSGKAIFQSKPRVVGISASTKQRAFVAADLSLKLRLKGSLNVKGSGKGSGSANTKPPATKDPKPPATKDPKPPATKDPKPPATKDPKPPATKDPKPPATKDPKPPVTPEPEPEPEVETPDPIEPPEEPPENVFGYDKPVRGCFEGIVYPLAVDTQKLPTNYSSLEPMSVVYACEWDIPTRDWAAGFPGVEDHFEWFAIRYSGAFAVETAGTWTFRISSDDGAKLYIDGKLVIDNDGQHPPEVKSGTVHLTKGDHEMVLEYFQGPRYHINLQLYATPPGGQEGIFSVR